jgi:replicative DNA helicase
MINVLSLPSAAEVLKNLDQVVRSGDGAVLSPLPSGFQPLDRHLNGGFHAGDLVLVGGAPGVGKTTLTLQMARNLANRPMTACAYVCYEHNEIYLMERLIALEAFLAREPGADVMSINEIRDAARSNGREGSKSRTGGLLDALKEKHIPPAAASNLRDVGQRLFLCAASRGESGISTMRQLVRGLKQQHGHQVALFVDYLQKVPLSPPPPTEAEGTTRIVNELKDLALTEEVPVIAVVAADREGLQSPRLRMHHLRGSSALAYEADVVLILNNKFKIVGKRSITFNPHQAQNFRNWIVCSIEKNRAGIDQIDLEFHGFFANAAFDPVGKVVAEELVDERMVE